jgi:hypothetical protein
MNASAARRALVAVSLLALASNRPLPARAAEAGTASTPATTPKSAALEPRRFRSPEAAVQALVAALRAGDTKALLGVLGSEGRGLIVSGDPVSDRQGRQRFVQAYDASHRLVVAAANTAILHIGLDAWPFPIPLVKDAERWRFDPRRGREEIIARRVGRNELSTMQVCLAYVDAQREYYTQDRDGDGILEYAQRFDSRAGKRDGLYWPTPPAEPPSPLGTLVVSAQAQGYRRSPTAGQTPFHGYLFRILTGQGPAARDGAYDYIVNGHMIAGFGLVAFPAEYGASGVMTFIVNHDGVVYQKDLGSATDRAASTMHRFDPDATWTTVEIQEAEHRPKTR